MTRRFDLTGAWWAVLEPLLPAPKRPGRPSSFWSRRPAEDAQWWPVPGLSSLISGYVSFEFVNCPGYYLRHADYDFSSSRISP
ncbi:AbfB domain-containing protein [Plantactinospora sp. CA-294935]|uniref:AbfB domain-containing protein n=1 Tax=Plantactinospora sp. CA-294935 TaxID=3240012 RepID=UPI003D9309E7